MSGKDKYVNDSNDIILIIAQYHHNILFNILHCAMLLTEQYNNAVTHRKLGKVFEHSRQLHSKTALNCTAK